MVSCGRASVCVSPSVCLCLSVFLSTCIATCLSVRALDFVCCIHPRDCPPRSSKPTVRNGNVPAVLAQDACGLARAVGLRAAPELSPGESRRARSDQRHGSAPQATRCKGRIRTTRRCRPAHAVPQDAGDGDGEFGRVLLPPMRLRMRMMRIMIGDDGDDSLHEWIKLRDGFHHNSLVGHQRQRSAALRAHLLPLDHVLLLRGAGLLRLSTTSHMTPCVPWHAWRVFISLRTISFMMQGGASAGAPLAFLSNLSIASLPSPRILLPLSSWFILLPSLVAVRSSLTSSRREP